MKRTVFLALALLALMAVGLYAQTEADFDVDVSKDGKSISIVEYIGKATVVVIPAKIKNLPVTTIDRSSFSATNITSVTIPDSVTNIRQQAFYNCKSLTSITIPASVKTIELSAFSDCRSLTSVTFGGLIQSGDFNENAFRSLGDIRDKYLAAGGGAGTYTRPAGGTTWTKQAASTAAPATAGNPESDFSVTAVGNGISITGYKGSVLAVIIPDKIQNKPVTVIGNNAFRTQNITSVIIPSSVTEINLSAFSACEKLTSVTIPNSVTKIGGYAFRGSSLTSVTFSGSIPSSGFEVTAFDGQGDIRDKYLAASGGPGTYTRPAGGTTWTKGASAAAVNPESDFSVKAVGNGISITGYKGSVLAVIIPDKIQNKPVTVIDNNAFRTQNITSVIIPSSVTEINQSAFSACEKLTSVTIPNSVTKIGGYAFRGSSLTSVTFSGSIPSSGFEVTAFDGQGDIRDKYLAGGAGTYTRPSGGTTWTKK